MGTENRLIKKTRSRSFVIFQWVVSEYRGLPGGEFELINSLNSEGFGVLF